MKLSIEIKGASGGESVQIGVKDSYDPDTGSETKINISGITTEYRTLTYPLTLFASYDATRSYIPAEFVFNNSAAHVYIRNIKFTKQ